MLTCSNIYSNIEKFKESKNMNRKEYNLLVEGWRNFLLEGEAKDNLSKEDVLDLAQNSQLNNGPMGLHVTFAVGEGGKPFWSNKLSCSELKGGELSGLKGTLVKSEYGYVGIDLDDSSISQLREKYGDFIEACKQDKEDTGLKYSLPHHITFGMGGISKLKLKNSEGKKIKHDLSAFEGDEFSFKAEGVCCEEVEGVMICAVKIGF